VDKVTIKEVAELSNTSVRTVSRVINNHPNVKPSTRERVKQAIKDLDFKVNFVARSLKGQSTNQVVVFIDQRSGEYWGAYHNEVFQELHRLIKAHNYRIVISPSSPNSFEDDDNDGFHLVKNKLCDGAIIFDPINNDQRVRYLKEHGIPFVLMGDSEQDFDVSYVGVDNFEIGYIGARKLFAKGYRSPVLFLGNEESIINKKRAQGFISFCKEHGLEPSLYYGAFNLETVHKKANSVLKNEKIDSFFVSGDERAIPVYKAIQEKGLSIGKDIGVLGIDNISMGNYMFPGLSTIAQPKHKIAEAVVDLLIAQMGKSEHEPKKITFQPEFVERQSL